MLSPSLTCHLNPVPIISLSLYLPCAASELPHPTTSTLLMSPVINSALISFTLLLLLLLLLLLSVTYCQLYVFVCVSCRSSLCNTYDSPELFLHLRVTEIL
ncbi:Hypothetical predicted protein [Octopus vulgaris]|uniref:Uncharacterized protein n=1 Tax=Octopus vulgaris TaxID=6645 RepID=A0AA36F3W7_OCTVU|nr:Hypothetical predicted protein [Octopus vulgaris]